MANNTIVLFKIALFMHLGMSAIMLTNHNILSVEDLGYLDQVNAVKSVDVVDQSLSENSFTKRFSSGLGLVYLIFIILIIVGFIFQKFIIGLLILICKPVCKATCCCLHNSKQE